MNLFDFEDIRAISKKKIMYSYFRQIYRLLLIVYIYKVG